MRQRLLIVLTALVCLGTGSARAQNEWLDTILPANHLLEKLPVITVDGQEEPGGLFDFLDLNGDGKKDLILAYRAPAAASDLEKPHDQILAVCFYDPKGNHYVKLFEDVGGTMSAIRVLSQGTGQRKLFFVVRGGGGGVSLTRGFAVTQGKVTRLFELKTPPVYFNAVNAGSKIEAWVSSKKVPASKTDAEKAFAWNESKGVFLAKDGETLGDRVMEPTSTPTVTLTATFTRTLTPTKTPVPPKKKATHTPVPEEPTSTPTAVTVAQKTEPVATPSKKIVAKPVVKKPAQPGRASSPGATKALKWWDEPMVPSAAYAKLRDELVPNRVKNAQMPLLGQQAKSFFAEMTRLGVNKQEVSDYRAGYYTAVAKTLHELDQDDQAAYYLDLVLKSRPDYQEALDFKAVLGR
jgi:hypothetical protein